MNGFSAVLKVYCKKLHIDTMALLLSRYSGLAEKDLEKVYSPDKGMH